MRVCLVAHSFFPASFYGGPIFSTLDLCKKLAQYGVNVYVSTTNANGNSRLDVLTDKFIELRDNLFVKYYSEQIIYYFSFSFLLNLWKDIRKSDLVYIQYIFHYTVPIALFYSWLFNKDTIICPRASLSPWGINWRGKQSSFLKNIWIKLFIRPFAYQVRWQGCSHIEVTDILSYFPGATCFELPDGVDVKSFSVDKSMCYRDVIKKYTGREFKEVTDIVFSMGRLHEIKGFDMLIHSFSLLLEKKPKAKLLIAGEDDEYQIILERLISKMQLHNSVFLIGKLDNYAKKEVLAHTSIFALCSHVESFGIVVVEALASGTPVVVSDKTIWRDLEKKKCGIFVSNKKDLFANGLLLALSSKYSSIDCINYANNYDIERVAKKFINLCK